MLFFSLSESGKNGTTLHRCPAPLRKGAAVGGVGWVGILSFMFKFVVP